MAQNEPDTIISHRIWCFDKERSLLRVNGQTVRAQNGVINLLAYLINREGHVVSKEELIANVWHGRQVSDAAIYNRVSALRRALQDEEGEARCIQWEYGRGLRLVRTHGAAPVEQVVFPGHTRIPVAKETPPPSRFQGASNAADWTQYFGTYHTMYRTPSWPEAIKIGVTVLKPNDQGVMVWTSEHGQDDEFGIRQRARYRGYAELIDTRIYVHEQSQHYPRAVCLTVLEAPYAHRSDLLTGMMMGSSWRFRGSPYTSRVIWRRVPAETSLRDAIRQSGPVADGSNEIEPKVRDSIGPDCWTFADWDAAWR
ncbi:MAG: winged helix-turn-helix domain-containing protein [Pseudomonadota bacterium]